MPEFFLDELSADLIEASKYRDYPEGTLGAIQYLSKQYLSQLQTSIQKDALEKEIIRARAAESIILQGFSDFLPSWGAYITLSQEMKIVDLKPFIEPISHLFTLRNKHNPQELKKLDILQSTDDTSNYLLSINFKQHAKSREYFIKKIRIYEKEWSWY